jgi:ABC-type transport system involved in cytochrome bd biosynthesis fused ATPase/permease subunit
MVEVTDVMYLAAPLLLILSVLSWHGAHGVSLVLMLIMTVMAPVIFYIVYSEKFDEYWRKREEEKPAQVGYVIYAARTSDLLLTPSSSST